MKNTELMPVRLDAGITISSVLNGPHGNAVIFGCTICVLAVIAGYCYLTADGHHISLSIGNSHIQASTDVAGRCDE